jgi:hypothetical protein
LGESVELNKVEGERSDALDLAQIEAREERYRLETYDKPVPSSAVTPLDLIAIPKLAAGILSVAGKSALKLGIVAGVKFLGKQAGTHEAAPALGQAAVERLIPEWRLITKAITAPKITPSNYRGITRALRQWATDVARRGGYTGKVDVGHILEHEFAEPGQRILVRPLERAVNRAEGSAISLAAAARRVWNASLERVTKGLPELFTRH